MTQQRFRLIRSIFEAAVECDSRTRPAYLADACAGDPALADEVNQLLAAHEASDGAVDMPALAQQMRVDPPIMERRQLGAYQVLRELGRGGMGIVYLARRSD